MTDLIAKACHHWRICDGDELALPVAESLVIRRTLQVQVKEDESNQQRENIFHTRCYVQSKGIELQFLTDQPIDAIWRRRRSFKGNFMN